MFYSNDLLGKKSPLGSVWMAAHHKKINKGTIMQINVSETCNKIMDPEIPQALRLQAILATGVVIIHSKQATFLLEDCTHALQHVINAMEEVPPPNLDRKVAETADITLADDANFMGMFDIFPAFPAQLQLDPSPALPARSSLQRQVSEDLFLMPSLPSNPALRPSLSDGSKQRPISGAFESRRFGHMEAPETFDAPEFNEADMALFFNNDFFPPPMLTPDDQPPMNMEYPEPPSREEEEAAAAAAAAAQRARAGRKRRTKKAQIDDLANLQLTQDAVLYRGNDARHKLLRHRVILPNTTNQTLFPGPASFDADTAASLYGELWDDMVKVPEAAKGPAKRSRKGDTTAPAAAGGEGFATPQPGHFEWAVDMEMPPPMEMGGWDPLPEELPGNDFQRQDYYYGHGELADVDVELERLRMALNGNTPGQSRGFMHLGATPGSKDGIRSGSKRGRNSSARSDSEGSYSERSTDPREGRRLSDLLQVAMGGDLDAGNLLPPVGEDEPFLDEEHELGLVMRKRLRSGSLAGKPFSSEPLSQFQLVEESAPDGLASLPSIPAHLGRQTEVVLYELQNMLENKEGEKELSLLDLSSKLGRLPAARLFYQILVCRSFGLIYAEQQEEMGDILISAMPGSQGM